MKTSILIIFCLALLSACAADAKKVTASPQTQASQEAFGRSLKEIYDEEFLKYPAAVSGQLVKAHSLVFEPAPGAIRYRTAIRRVGYPVPNAEAAQHQDV